MKPFSQERYQAALELFQKIIIIDPNHAEAAYFMAQIYANQGQYQEAILYCEQLLKVDTLAITPHLDLTHIYGQEGDEKRAIKMYQESLNILQSLPPEMPITERGNLTASQLLIQLQKAN